MTSSPLRPVHVPRNTAHSSTTGLIGTMIGMIADRRSRAVASLHGLAIGDTPGSCFFIPDNHTALQTRQLPPDPWWWTDHTEMACSIVTILNQHGRIDQESPAASYCQTLGSLPRPRAQIQPVLSALIRRDDACCLISRLQCRTTRCDVVCPCSTFSPSRPGG